jgi:hypothetical protein
VSLSFRKYLPFRLLLSVFTITHSTIFTFVVESDTLDVKEHPSNGQKPQVERTEAVRNGIVKGQ